MKKSRNSKPAFAKPVPTPTPSTSLEPRPPAQSTSPALSPPIVPPTRPQEARPFEPPSDPTSTAPGSGLTLLRHLHPPRVGWAALQHYPPQNVAIILGPLLEPDSLAQFLAALRHGLSSRSVDLTNAKARIKTIMQGLKSTSRWRINVAMLSKTEAQIGRTLWEECGAEGSWP